MYRVLKQVLHRTREQMSRLWVHEHSVILRKRIEQIPPDPSALQLREYASYDPAILALYQQESRGLEEARLRARFSHGMRFYVLSQTGETLAWTWMLSTGARFVDEIGYRFPTGPDGLWERDVYVLPHARGRQVYAALLDAVLRRFYPNARVMYANVTVANEPSMRAHTHYGFEIMDRLRAVHVAGLLLFRLRTPTAWPDLSGYCEHQRIVLTGRAYREYRASYLA